MNNSVLGAEWFCEHLRLTVFTQPSELEKSDAWWGNTIGEAPARSTIERKIGKRVADGPYKDRILSLTVLPTRIDWVLGADPAQPAMDTGFPSIGSLKDSLITLDRVREKWLTSPLPPVTRLAVGTAIMLPVRDRSHGYRSLQELLPAIKLDPENSREFLYQINRPRASTVVQAMEVNRLCRWSVATFVVQSFMLGHTTVSPTVQSIACRIEPDVSTDASRTEPYPPEQLPLLYEELVHHLNELLQNGDAI